MKIRKIGMDLHALSESKGVACNQRVLVNLGDPKESSKEVPTNKCKSEEDGRLMGSQMGHITSKEGRTLGEYALG